MLRVHFTAGNIARLRVAVTPDPLWEIANSFQILIGKDSLLVFDQWRSRVRPRLIRDSAALLTALLPPRGYSPDFLTPDLGGCPDLESAVDTVLRTSKTTLRGDLTRLVASPVRQKPPPTGLRALAGGEPEALHDLGTALHGYYRRALEEFWPHICAQVTADGALRARAVLTGTLHG
ncbi:hypothetical protein NGF19_29340 [Streptomyces sp. RY43-2]|uniref:Transcriptional regulator n=1 Tax=Streptomyces macrolidinus TaxID=2952607 RepID=A0ABT0ZML2_9ACTN|nr:hypothetical protein [Streptomyces macrolidinus]MCN9244836.1 hypothetical protein [Streptomyces macrolidinus]